MDFLDFHHLSYPPSLLVSLLDCIQCPHRMDVCKSLLVSQQWWVHMLESIREHYLWVCPYVSSNALHIFFILLVITPVLLLFSFPLKFWPYSIFITVIWYLICIMILKNRFLLITVWLYLYIFDKKKLWVTFLYSKSNLVMIYKLFIMVKK